MCFSGPLSLRRENRSRYRHVCFVFFSDARARMVRSPAAAAYKHGKQKQHLRISSPIFPAVLQVKIQVKITPSGSGPNPRILKDNDSPDPPSGPPGGGGQGTNNKRPLIQLGLRVWPKSREIDGLSRPSLALRSKIGRDKPAIA